MAAPPPPPIPLADLVTVAVQQTHAGLVRLSQQLSDKAMPEDLRRRFLLEYVAKAQSSLLRVLVLAR